MVRNGLRRVSTLGFCVLLAGSIASAADRTAETIIAEINAIKIPSSESTREPAEVTKRLKLADQKARLILELYKLAPSNPELARLMPERWQLRPSTVSSNPTTKNEIAEILAKSKNPKLVAEAAYFKASLQLKNASELARPDDVMLAIDDFARRFPKDDRVPQLLFQAASAATDQARKADILARIQKDYSDSPAGKKLTEQADPKAVPKDISTKIGTPFVLEFTDAIKGVPVSVQALKGKLVVIDFWATWNPPCVAEVPNMKKLYAEYKDKGVEFIGVSLDQPKEKGGLDRLKAFVARNELEWPQYYQGHFWASEFSSSWHVESLPRVFLVDAEGKLASVNAQGQLEKLIPEYLEKAKKKAGVSTTAGKE